MCKNSLLIASIVAYTFPALAGSAPKQNDVLIDSTTQIEELGGGEYKVVAELKVTAESLTTMVKSQEHPKREILRTDLDTTAQGICMGSFTLTDLMEFDVITTHSDDAKIRIEAHVQCNND